MKTKVLITAMAVVLSSSALAQVADSVIAEQRAQLAANTAGKGFGPQSPRDLDQEDGNNFRLFSEAPSHTQMNLCNIHFHAAAEHKGGEFTTYAGNGDGEGYNTGYVYNGTLAQELLAQPSRAICPGPKGSLQSGDTIEVHYVFSSAQVQPGATLGSCLADGTMNPQLRVEGQVLVLVNDANAADFQQLAAIGTENGYHQALNIPTNTGDPIEYAGSTTGPAYNTQGSPLQVSWSVRPEVAYVNIDSVGAWCDSNPFEERAAHGVRNLVINPDLISDIDD